MNRVIVIWIVVFIGWVAAGEMASYIAVAYGEDPQRMEHSRAQLEQILRKDVALRTEIAEAKANITVDHVAGFHVVRLGPFVPDERFALTYLTLRMSFPQAVVIEQPRPLRPAVPVPHAPAVAPPTKGTAVALPSAVEETDNSTIWTALFGLAIIGILYMFLSSDQLRRMKKEHAEIEARQKKLEIKQHSVLAQMGENIHTLAQETATRTHTLAQKAQGALLHDDVQKVIEGENTLLGMTGDLIKFLQIKAHKVTIQNAPFDFNNVLHEVAGTLHSTCGRSDKELVFDLAQDVPKLMEADSLHMAQVLTNLIEYLMCHTASDEVYLKADVRVRSDKIQILEVRIRSDVGGIDEEKFFDAYYDESTGKYVGLGLFVAKELVELMGGALVLEEGGESSTRIQLTFPVGKRSSERRQYRLPDQAVMDAKVLIIDRNPDVMRALEHLLTYFDMKTTRMPVETLERGLPDFSKYDIVAIDNTLWNDALIQELQHARTQGKLRVISLENLYASHTVSDEGSADVHMKKPLTQQHVLDVLIQLGAAEASETHREIASEQAENIPEVYRGDFSENRSVTLEDFSRFAGRRLMIVEDNLVNQKVLKGMLSKAGLILTVANNGQEALDLLEENAERVEMILMDISMPVMDGFTATRRIHEESRFQSIPIVTLTALVSEHEVDKMFDSGANGYLSKPLKIGRLYSAMERFLSPAVSAEEAMHSSPSPIRSSEQGLDTQEAMGAMQGDALLYREVLNEFREIYGNSDAVFEKLIRDTRYEQLKTLCVDLRGLTGSIGAKGLFDVVSEALTMMLYDKHHLLERYIEPYREELTRLNDAIERYLR